MVLIQVLVTGASGFLGGDLARFLSARCPDVEVVAWSRSEHFALPDRIPLVKDVDVCFHFAAVTDGPWCERNPEQARAVNVEGTLRLAEMLSDHSKDPLFVFASTIGVYESDEPLGPDSPMRPNNVYSRTKWEAERKLDGFKDNLRVMVVRPVFPYGVRSGPDRLIRRLMSQIGSGQPVYLNRDDKPRCNPVYTDDFLDFCHGLLSRPPREVYSAYNLGGPDCRTIRELSEAISSVLSQPVRFVQRDSIVPNFVADNRYARKHRGYAPSVGFSEGLSRMLSSRPE